MTSPHTPPISPELERLAYKRASSKLGFYKHAIIYVMVNLGLSLLAWNKGQSWSLWPLGGWGIGLFFHALTVFTHGWGGSLRERLTERERERLRGQG